MYVLLAALVGTSLFPLTPGHRWTFRDVESGAKLVIAVRPGRVLHGFPGARDLRVRRSGQTVRAWDEADGRWETWFRLGAPIKTTYVVQLAATPLWQKVEVRVAAKSAAVRDRGGKLHRGCTRFAFRQLGGVADAGLTEMSFCPGVGPVRYSETTIAGPRTYALQLPTR
jgi:hypothetical protein